MSTRGRKTNKVINDGINSNKSKIPVVRSSRTPRRSSSTSRLSQANVPPARGPRSKSSLYETPLQTDKALNPQQLFPPEFSVSHNRLLPSPKSSKKSAGMASSVKNSAQRTREVDTRPFNDKRWQQNQLIKIQHYLQRDEFKNSNLDRNSLRPLSINSFIEICNFIFTKLDKKLVITKENYVEELPFILSSFGYPSAQNLKKSLMKAINIPRNWPMAIGVLSWLVELVEGNEVFDYESNIHGIKKIILNITFDLYNKMKNQQDIPENVDEQVYEKLLEYENLSPEEFIEIKEKIELAEGKLENLCHEEFQLLETKKVYGSKKDTINKILKDVEKNQELKHLTIKKIEHYQRNISENEKFVERLYKENEQLLRAIQVQPVTKDVYLETVNKCSELEQEIASLNKLIDNLKECTYSEERKLKRKNDHVVAKMEEYNKKCLSNITELNSFAVYDIPLLNPNSHGVLMELKTEMKETWEKELKRSEKLDQQAMEYQDWIKKMKELDVVENVEIPKLKDENTLLREEIEQKKEVIQHYKIETEKHVNKLKEIEKELARVEDMKKLLKIEAEKKLSKMEEEYCAYEEAAKAKLEEIYAGLDNTVKVAKRLLGEGDD